MQKKISSNPKQNTGNKNSLSYYANLWLCKDNRIFLFDQSTQQF